MSENESFDRYEKEFRHLRPMPDEKILDAGCREGLFVRKCDEKGFSSIGVDISLDAVKDAKVNAGGGNIIRADLTRLLFPNEVFDKVALLDVIEHFDKNGRRNCLKEINRVFILMDCFYFSRRIRLADLSICYGRFTADCF